MPTSSPTVLAINPGTRYLGMAVFHGTQLLDWRVKVLKGRWSKEKLKKAVFIVDSVTDRYRPDHLAIKEFNASRTSPRLNSIIEQMEKLALRNSIKVHRYSIKALEAFFCQQQMNKRALADAVAANYPELYREFQVEKSRKNPYHMRMFEAVALGAMCINKLDK